MSDDVRRVLELLAQKRVSVDDAAELIGALRGAQTAETSSAGAPAGDPGKRRYMRINMHKAGRDGQPDKEVHIRVPMTILRSGLRLGAIVPEFARERVYARLREQGVDIDLSKLDPAHIESLLADLGEVNIDVNHGEEQVRITCE